MTEADILVGDAGGTNVRFAVARATGDGRIHLTHLWKRPGADFPTFEAALDAWLGEHKPKLSGASFGFAGPVVRDEVRLLHRNWIVTAESLRAHLGVSRVVMVNDFFAMARSAPELAPDETAEIAPGRADPQGSLAVGGPGTGFGVGVLRKYAGDGGEGWVVVGGEGGHQTYTPQTVLEWRLAEELKRRAGYVSHELIASGSGFQETLCALACVMGAPERKASQPEIIDQAKAGDPLALEFCRLRARCVMTAMGNLALVANATGGVFIAGGVSARLLPWLKETDAIARFRQRGPRTGLLAAIPIRLITSEAAPLVGSARLWLDERARGWL